MSNDTAGSCYPLQEVLRTAFPDLKFTTMQVMNMQDDLARRFGQVIERRQADSSPTPAPAPMTAANPGNQSLGPSRYIEVDREKYDALTARVAELERELAAARKVEDGEVELLLAPLRERASPESSVTQLEREFAANLIDLLTRLSAALKRAKCSRDGWRHDARVYADNAQAAEAKLLDWLLAIAGGRRASIGSQDNTYCPQLSRERVDAEIRALQTKDTTP